MKTCALCGFENEISAVTCVACGEGTWLYSERQQVVPSVTPSEPLIVVTSGEEVRESEPPEAPKSEQETLPDVVPQLVEVSAPSQRNPRNPRKEKPDAN